MVVRDGGAEIRLIINNTKLCQAARSGSMEVYHRTAAVETEWPRLLGGGRAPSKRAHL